MLRAGSDALLLLVQGIHVNASSWPGTSYFLKRQDVAAIVQSPGVAEVAKAVSKKPPQVSWLSSLLWCCIRRGAHAGCRSCNSS